jgi:dolichol-phosphate mannosyltransferase
MYSEESSIPLLKRQLRASGFVGVDRVIPVNDGSKDRTLELLQEWQREDPRLHIVSYTPNRGLPAACTAGFIAAIEAGAGKDPDDVLITMDSDASHPMDLIPAMVQKIHEGYDIVVASRHLPGASQRGLTAARKVFSWGASTLMRMSYPVKGLRDYSTNFRAYRASLVKEALDKSGGRLVEATGFVGVVELLLRLCSLNPKTTEVPLNLRYDLKESESKMRVWRTIRGYLTLISKDKVHSKIGTCLPLLNPPPAGKGLPHPPGEY